MATRCHLRGHSMVFKNNEWLYLDTMSPTADNPRLHCGWCGKPDSKEGHDGCLQTLPGVMNACCGHGKKKGTYVQFLDGYVVRGRSAQIILEELKKHKGKKAEVIV